MARYRPAPNVQWCVEPWGLLVLDRARATSHTVHYPCAAVWDLMTRGSSFERTVPIVGVVAGVDAAHSEALVRDVVHEWLAAGLIVEVDDGG